MRYVKKPIEVDAIRLTPDNFDEVKKFIDKEEQHIEFYSNEVDFVKRENPRGMMLSRDRMLRIGEYVVKEADGEFYSMSEYLFDMVHEPVISPESIENPKQLSLFPEFE
jgi:hypothetical protein